jgi:hypothetical protein
MESMPKQHFDAWGNPILGFLEMIRYYSGDERSLTNLRHFGLQGVVVIPSVEIEIRLDNPGEMFVMLVYPAGWVRNRIIMTDRVKTSMRHLYVSPETHWRHYRGDNSIIWKRKGRVIRALWTNLYSLPLSA